MSAKKLCRRMDNKIGPVLKRADQIRSAERVVDHKRDMVPVRDPCDRIQIRNIAVRIAQRFQKNGFRLRTDGSFHSRQIMGIHKSRRNAEVGKIMGHQVIRSAIYRFLRHDMAAILRQRLQSIGDRRRARSQGKSCRAAFERRHPLFQHFLCRVCQPAVNIAGIAERKTAGCLIAAVENVRSRLIDRDSPRTRCRIRQFLSNMKLQCFKMRNCHVV